MYLEKSSNQRLLQPNDLLTKLIISLSWSRNLQKIFSSKMHRRFNVFVALFLLSMWNRFIIVMKGSAIFGKTKLLLNSLRVIIVLTFVAAIAKLENHKERRTQFQSS